MTGFTNIWTKGKKRKGRRVRLYSLAYAIDFEGLS